MLRTYLSLRWDNKASEGRGKKKRTEQNKGKYHECDGRFERDSRWKRNFGVCDLRIFLRRRCRGRVCVGAEVHCFSRGTHATCNEEKRMTVYDTFSQPDTVATSMHLFNDAAVPQCDLQVFLLCSLDKGRCSVDLRESLLIPNRCPMPFLFSRLLNVHPLFFSSSLHIFLHGFLSAATQTSAFFPSSVPNSKKTYFDVSLPRIHARSVPQMHPKSQVENLNAGYSTTTATLHFPHEAISHAVSYLPLAAAACGFRTLSAVSPQM